MCVCVSRVCSCMCVCVVHHRTADHFLDVITPRMDESVEDLVAREKKLSESYSSKASPVDVNEGEP